MAAHIDAVELTKQMVRMNTINPPGDEEHCARHLGVLLENAGFKVTYHQLSSKRASLVATIGGSSEKAPLCFTGHIDTVPLGAAKWKMDPFAADTDAGKLYGRGTSDMKCGCGGIRGCLCEPLRQAGTLTGSGTGDHRR